MIQIKKSVVALEEEDVIELQQIILDENREQALAFLKNTVYNRIVKAQKPYDSLSGTYRIQKEQIWLSAGNLTTVMIFLLLLCQLVD